MGNIIEVNNLTFRYNDRFIFDKFKLNIKEGSFTSITGSNGSGKSTLIKILIGLLKTECDIKICGYDLNEENIFNIRKNIGVIFDNPDNLFLCETVEDDLVFSLENLCYSKDEMEKELKEISKKLKISNLLKKSPNELSGGEKTKVALASALIHRPKILLIDESISMIDEIEKNEILEILSKLNKEGMTIINIAHDLRETYYSDRLIVINDGKIMLDGLPLKVMEYDKILNRLGINLPFEIELSIKLKLYGIIDEIIPNIEMLVNTIWQ